MIILLALLPHTISTAYPVEVYATDLDGAVYVERIVHVTPREQRTPPQQMPGWPQNMGSHPNYRPSGVNLADLNGDGYLEIIAGSTNGSFHVWDYQGNELTGWPKTGLDQFQSKAAVGDLDTSYAGLEIVAAGRGGTLYAWHNDGSNVSGWPISVGETGSFKSPVLFDIDNDALLEVILGQRYYPTGRVIVFRHDGTAQPGWPQTMDYMCVATPSVGDLDGDTAVEISAVSYNSVYVWDRNGSLMPGWPRLNVAGGMSYAQPVFADLDDDDDCEILHSYYTSGQNYVGIYHHDATNFLSWPYTFPGPQTYSMPVTGDIDSDDDLETFGGGHVIGGVNLGARHHTGTIVAGWPVVVEMLECSPIIFDLDDDGDREIVVGDNLNPGNFYAFHGNGTYVTDWPIPTTAAAIVNSASVGDVDGDGDIEVALIVSDGTVNLWTIDNVPYKGYMSDWSTFFHDQWNTGWFHPMPPQNLIGVGYPDHASLSWNANQEPDIAGYSIYRSDGSGGPYVRINDTLILGISYDDYSVSSGSYYYCVTAEILANTESRLSNESSVSIGINENMTTYYSMLSIAPNPFTNSVSFNCIPKLHQHITIYNVVGTKICEIEGHGSLTWHPAVIPPGIYFAEITVNDEKTVEKIIKLR